jgi:uncharacterized protein YecE (DUF72 family)
MAGKIRIGTASWTDPGFVQDWYPAKLPASQRLRWYADHFNLVEVNSTFYSLPVRQVVQKWCRDTPEGFIFDVKLHKLLSRHSAEPKLLPPDLRRKAEVKAGRVVLTPQLERAVARRFVEDIDPFLEAGKMGALLLQLSPSFRPKTHQLADLNTLFESLQGIPLAVELRNRDWVTGDQRADTLSFFAKRNITLVSVDGPNDGHFMIMPSENYVTSPKLSYLRLHGRNAEGYIRGRSVPERFNYLYNAQELDAIAERTVQMAQESQQVHVVYNNNRADYAPKNAAEFARIIQERFPGVSTWIPPQKQNLELNLQ